MKASFQTTILAALALALALVVLPVALGSSRAQAQSELKLSPQMVVDLALSKGLGARAAELEAQRSFLALEEALGVFDLQLTLMPGYEYNEAQSLTGLSNPVDRTYSLTSTLTKRFRTGTTLALEYRDISQNSTLNPFLASLRPEHLSLTSTTLSLRQALWSNSFGVSDRRAVSAARALVDTASQLREEKLEDVILTTLRLFWDTYIAEQQLKENMAGREKYEQLVKSVRRKQGYLLASPGELPRVEAEFEAADQRVKISSAEYLTRLEALKSALQIASEEKIALVVPTDLPPVPQLRPKDVESLRAVNAAKLRVDSAERQSSSLLSKYRPMLDLVVRATATGQDQEASRAQAEMTSGEYPTYFVGLEFKAGLDSNLSRGRRADARVQVSQAETELQSQRDLARNRLSEADRHVASQFFVAQSATTAAGLRQRVVQQLEDAYRNGRQPLIELIRSYNELFDAQLKRAQAIGEYHIALNRLAAARDELVQSAQNETGNETQNERPTHGGSKLQ